MYYKTTEYCQCIVCGQHKCIRTKADAIENTICFSCLTRQYLLNTLVIYYPISLFETYVLFCNEYIKVVLLVRFKRYLAAMLRNGDNRMRKQQT